MMSDNKGMEELKALANPIRMKIYALLRMEGRKTIGEIADDLGLAVGSVSYHVSKLSEPGLVVAANAPDEDRRRSYWMAKEGDSHLETPRSGPEELIQLSDAFRSERDAFQRNLYSRYVECLDCVSPDWIEAEMNSDSILMLTPDQLKQMHRELEAVLAKWDATGNGEGEQTAGERVVVLMRGFRWM